MLRSQTEVQAQVVAHAPLILRVDRLDVAARRFGDSAVVDRVVPVGAATGALGHAAEREAPVPEDVDVTARVVRVDVVRDVLVAEAALQRVLTALAGVEDVVVIHVEGGAFGRVERRDQ